MGGSHEWGRSQVTDPRRRHPPKPHPPRKAQSEEGGGVKKGSERKTKVTRSAVHTENQKSGTRYNKRGRKLRGETAEIRETDTEQG